MFAMGRGAQGVCTYVKTGVWTKARYVSRFSFSFFPLLSLPPLLISSLLFYSLISSRLFSLLSLFSPFLSLTFLSPFPYLSPFPIHFLPFHFPLLSSSFPLHLLFYLRPIYLSHLHLIFITSHSSTVVTESKQYTLFFFFLKENN